MVFVLSFCIYSLKYAESFIVFSNIVYYTKGEILLIIVSEERYVSL